MLKGKSMGMVVVGAVVMAGAVLLVLALTDREKTQVATEEVISLGAIPQEYLMELEKKNVFFGHQSVGENLIDGLTDIVKDNSNIQLVIVESKDTVSSSKPAIIHFKIGRNTRPKSKLLAFRRILDSDESNQIDIAMLKFCYVDIRYGDNPEEIFDQYKTTLSDLKVRHPNVVFIHSTVPIESRRANAKRIIKEGVKALIGKPGVTEDNQVRQRYNDLLRATYESREPVFDIARYEAIGPGGSMSYRLLDSEQVFMMDRRYTNDGGHLNDRGRRHIAEQLLVTLALAAAEEEKPESS